MINKNSEFIALLKEEDEADRQMIIITAPSTTKTYVPVYEIWSRHEVVTEVVNFIRPRELDHRTFWETIEKVIKVTRFTTVVYVD